MFFNLSLSTFALNPGDATPAEVRSVQRTCTQDYTSFYYPCKAYKGEVKSLGSTVFQGNGLVAFVAPSSEVAAVAAMMAGDDATNNGTISELFERLSQSDDSYHAGDMNVLEMYAHVRVIDAMRAHSPSDGAPRQSHVDSVLVHSMVEAVARELVSVLGGASALALVPFMSDGAFPNRVELSLAVASVMVHLRVHFAKSRR